MSANPWIRLYRASLHNPKIVTLSDRQHRAWHNCLLIADDTGSLPAMRDVSVHMRVTICEAEQLICELVEAQLIDPETSATGQRTYKLHDWSAHQYVSDSSTARSQKHRKKKQCNGDATLQQRQGNGDVTLPDSDPDTETDKNNPTVETVSARGDFENLNLGVGLGVGEVSVDAKRDVCKMLGIADCEPLVENFKRWKPSRRARDVDAHFRAFAKRNIARLSEAELQRIRLPVPEPPPITPAKPSSSLLKTLKVGRYAN